MNDLTLTPNSPPAMPTMPELGKALSALLDAPGSPDEAAQAIIHTPALLAETREALPALQHVATAKAGTEGVRKVIAKRFATYPQPQRTDEEWANWWADYFDTLTDVSLASLEAAMRAHVADPASEFMPKPGRLRELAFVTPCRSLMRYQRAKRTLQLADERQAEPQRPSPEEAAQIRQMAMGAVQKLSQASTRPELPSIAGKPDERGITPQMRDILARRQETHQ